MLTYRQLIARLRGGVLNFGNVDGTLWASNSYWALELDETRGRLPALLAAYNLEPEPMLCRVDDTIRRAGDNKANIAGLLTDEVRSRKLYDDVAPVTVAGMQVLAQPRGPRRETLELLEVAERKLAVNREMRETCEDLLGVSVRWTAHITRTSAPLVGRLEHTELEDAPIVALLMPVFLGDRSEW